MFFFLFSCKCNFLLVCVCGGGLAYIYVQTYMHVFSLRMFLYDRTISRVCLAKFAAREQAPISKSVFILPRPCTHRIERYGRKCNNNQNFHNTNIFFPCFPSFLSLVSLSVIRGLIAPSSLSSLTGADLWPRGRTFTCGFMLGSIFYSEVNYGVPVYLSPFPGLLNLQRSFFTLSSAIDRTIIRSSGEGGAKP